MATVATQREFTGAKAQRIIEATHASVARHGIAGATFEVIAAEAEVSRGLLQYYFGTKERLLVEVVRRDGEIRLSMLEATMRRADTLDQLVWGFADNLQQAIRDEPDYFAMLFEFFLAGQRSQPLRAAMAEFYENARKVMAALLIEKQKDGIVRLRFPPEDVAMHLIAAGEGAAMQLISDPQRDFGGAFDVGNATARFLLGASAV